MQCALHLLGLAQDELEREVAEICEANPLITEQPLWLRPALCGLAYPVSGGRADCRFGAGALVLCPAAIIGAGVCAGRGDLFVRCGGDRIDRRQLYR
ncbi:MAG: hypothetical protein JJ884_05720 [Maricaulis sp.]|nr:hypothetical protein [Maricaulis sp.]MBO6846999.1 hypothetical protein [Maricaulis sp.]MBO6876358.1 hypothetical protein [Maricaulis sp.]